MEGKATGDKQVELFLSDEEKEWKRTLIRE